MHLLISKRSAILSILSPTLLKRTKLLYRRTSMPTRQLSQQLYAVLFDRLSSVLCVDSILVDFGAGSQRQGHHHAGSSEIGVIVL